MSEIPGFITSICILFGLALYLYTGNGIHCLQLHPNKTFLSVDPIDFSEAKTESCFVRGIGVPPTPFDPLQIRTSAIVSMATMCGAVILTMALCESRSFQKIQLLLMKVFSFSYEKWLGHHEFDEIIRRASSFGSDYCKILLQSSP